MRQHRWRGALAAVGALIGLVACGPSELLGPDAAQGIEGIALLGPRCPVRSQQDPRSATAISHTRHRSKRDFSVSLWSSVNSVSISSAVSAERFGAKSCLSRR